MATPVEHYERAEELLEQAAGASDPLTAQRIRAEAQVHATLSNAPWAVDERVLDEVAAGLDAETVGALLAVVRELAGWADTAPTVPAGADGTVAEGWVEGQQADRATVAALVRPALELVELTRAAAEATRS